MLFNRLFQLKSNFFFQIRSLNKQINFISLFIIACLKKKNYLSKLMIFFELTAFPYLVLFMRIRFRAFVITSIKRACIVNILIKRKKYKRI